MRLKSICSLFVFLLTSCASTPCDCSRPIQPGPKWKPKIWIGEPKTMSVVRNKVGLKCAHPDFKQYFCMHNQDMEMLTERCLR